MDFKSADGTDYKNATVLKVMPDGLVISYIDANGFDDIRKVNTGELPDDIKKQYNLSSKTAAAFDSQKTAAIDAINAKKAEEVKTYYAEQKKDLEAYTNVTNYLNSIGINIVFNSTSQVDYGSIGDAFMASDYDDEDPMGKICLLGVSVEPSSSWTGEVYPLNKNTTYQTPFENDKIPCYADFDTAMDYFSNNPNAIEKPL